MSSRFGAQVPDLASVAIAAHVSRVWNALSSGDQLTLSPGWPLAYGGELMPRDQLGRVGSTAPDSILGAGGSREISFGGMAVGVHDHVCAFYRGRGQRARLVSAHLRQGLEAGEACLYIAPEDEAGNAREAFDVDSGNADRCRFEVRTPASTYLRGGAFHPQAMLRLISDWSWTTFQDVGCSYARVVGDMSWAAGPQSPEFLGQLFEYEAAANDWAMAYQQSAVCMYDLNHFGGDVFVSMVRAHTRTWLDGTVIDNPYYGAHLYS